MRISDRFLVGEHAASTPDLPGQSPVGGVGAFGVVGAVSEGVFIIVA